MKKLFYVYVIHEAPEEEPYFCKVGFSRSPLRRLDQLQAGNPRALRTWSYTRRPTQEFGYPLPSRAHAQRVERRVHRALEELDARMHRDYDYRNLRAEKREWFSGIHPKTVDEIVTNCWVEYLHEHEIDVSSLG